MKKVFAYRPKPGLAFKLIVYIFSSLALIFAVIFLYNYYISKKIVEKNIKTNARYITENTVGKIEKLLYAVQKIPDNFSKIIERSELKKEELIELLRMEVENNHEIFGAALAFEPFFFGTEEKYFSPYFCRRNNKTLFQYLGGENYNYYTMDWYQIPRELGRPVWSEPYFDEGGGNVIMTTYSVPLYRDKDGHKEFIGILTADVSLDWLQNDINSIKVYQTGYAFMISQTGCIVTHPVKEMIINESIFSIAQEQKSSQLREIGRKMIKGESSFAEIEYRNVRTGALSWIAYAPVTVNGWSVGVVFPVAELLADVNQLYKTIFFLGLGGLIIIFGVILFISRSITGSLRRLTLASEKLSQGEFDTELPDIRSKDEIGRLNSSFISMQTALFKTIGDLKDTSDKLKISNEKLEEYSRDLEQKVALRTVELQEKNKELDAAFNNVRTLNEIGKKITSTLNLEEIQNIVYDNVNSLLDATCFLIMVYHEKERKLECKLSIERGEKHPLYEISMDETDRFAVWCVLNCQPVFMNDVEQEYTRYVPRRAAPKAGQKVESLIYFPMMIENRVVGVISAQSYKKNAYTQHQFDMLNNLANYVAIALDNAFAYETLHQANTDLKAAQAQLVQSEKMASLGQLTAGIAHEIKNPLNFVNNFAELSVDLTRELAEEIDKLGGSLKPEDADYLKEIINDIRGNAQKISDHGKRADNIVRSMLLHSRGTSDDKQITDINAVLAEYVNLGYHGMRAQDSSFNIKIETDYDNTIGLINIVPQNISRVFLNIINNACYSTAQKKRELKDSYFPILRVSTKNLPDKIEIRIRDNGKGIPQSIIDKIFNPFFTTKPAGSGTGLGLSLSYDIVVAEYKGELRVVSEEGEFAEFIIIIPKEV